MQYPLCVKSSFVSVWEIWDLFDVLIFHLYYYFNAFHLGSILFYDNIKKEKKLKIDSDHDAFERIASLTQEYKVCDWGNNFVLFYILERFITAVL